MYTSDKTEEQTIDKNKAIVVFSGGQDSTTCLLKAMLNYDEVIALSFNYGQHHTLELESQRKITELLNIVHITIPLDTVFETSRSFLLQDSDIKISEAHPIFQGLPSTFVPLRNMIMLTVAYSTAINMGFGTVITGVCQTDYSGYPDCRYEFLDSLNQTITLALGLDDSEHELKTPLLDMTKGEIVQLAYEDQDIGLINKVLSLTHTCYNNQFPPCGICDACKLRAKGFKEANMPDPLVHRGEEC